MRTPWIFALAVAVSACGDGDGKPGSSGVDTAKKASDLTDDEARELCEFGDALLDVPTVDQACTGLGAVSTQDAAGCEQFVADCKANSTDDGGESDACDGTTADKFAGCDAPVGDIEACLEQAAEAYNRFLAETTCDDAGSGGLEPVSACAALKERCPGSFDDA